MLSSPFMPRPRRTPAALLFLALAAIAGVSPAPAGAAGYLWLGSEFQGEGNIYRFNLASSMIDKVSAHAGADHWNNVTIAGTSLFLGHPTTQTFNRHDAYTGDLVLAGNHSATLGGHKEDGAFFEGSLWRMTFSGAVLHRMTTMGVVESSFTCPTGLVGLEFVGTQGYATNYSTGRYGRLVRNGSTWSFVPAVWRSGFAPNGSVGALACDLQDGSMYMATSTAKLYRVTMASDTAEAHLVVDLSTVGYPSGGLVDGMAWIGPNPATSVDPSRLPGSGAIELGLPSPNPARDLVSFEVRLARPGPARVGIYDLNGRRLREWNLPGLGAGRSRFNWDLRNAAGHRVPAGRYLVRLEAHGERVTRAFSRLK